MADILSIILRFQAGIKKSEKHKTKRQKPNQRRPHKLSSSFFFLLNYVFNVYLFLRQRERETEHERGRGRERGRHRIRSRLQALSCQHRAPRGARTREYEIMTWAEVWRCTCTRIIIQSHDTEGFLSRKQLYSCGHHSVGFVPKDLSPECHLV